MQMPEYASPAGDLYVQYTVVLPEIITPALRKGIQRAFVFIFEERMSLTLRIVFFHRPRKCFPESKRRKEEG